MPKILALDTSTDACSVALACDGEITEEFALLPREHTQRLLPMVDSVLGAQGLTLRDLDAIAFGRGPGSFTGLRICLGIAQGLAFGANLPLVPVSTLAAMAAGAYRTALVADTQPVLVALDARMSEVYWGLYQHSDDATLVQSLTEEFVMPPGEVEGQLSNSEAGKLAAIGPGWHYEALAALKPQMIELDAYPHAWDIAALAQSALARGESVSALAAEPVYLRDTVSWKKRQRIRSNPMSD